MSKPASALTTSPCSSNKTEINRHYDGVNLVQNEEYLIALRLLNDPRFTASPSPTPLLDWTSDHQYINESFVDTGADPYCEPTKMGKSPAFFLLPKRIRELTKDEKDSLKKHYSITEPNAVFKFIEQNEFLVSPLAEAPEQIKKHFKKEILRLELLTDPESNQTELMLYIETNLNPEQSIDKLRKLDENWWLSKLYETKNRLCIHVSYKQI